LENQYPEKAIGDFEVKNLLENQYPEKAIGNLK